MWTVRTVQHLARQPGRHRLLTRRLCVPANFGGRDGPCISNKASILAEVDAALGGRPPDVEVLLTDHISDVSSQLSRALHTGVLRFGHVAVRYTTSDGVQRVMNILGDLEAASDARMVNFVPPQEYLYGTRGFDTFAQQGGVYNRPFVGLRIERVAPGATDAMHAYYLALDARSRVGQSPEVPGGVADAAGGGAGASGGGTSGGAGILDGVSAGAKDGQAGAGGETASAVPPADGSEGRASSDATAAGGLGGGDSFVETGSTGTRGDVGATGANDAPPAAPPKGNPAPPPPTERPREAEPRRAFSSGAARFQLVEARLSSVMNHLPVPIASGLEMLLRALNRAHRSTRTPAAAKSKDDTGGGTHPHVVSSASTLSLDLAPQLPAALSEATAGARRAAADVRASTYAAGNCAQWTSSGLEFAGLLRRTRLFPKAILIELLESETLRYRRGGNVNVVYYAQVSHATPRDPRYRYVRPAYVHPLSGVRNFVYSDMRSFASLVVHVPPGTTEAWVLVPPQGDVRAPPPWLRWWTAVVLGVPTLVCAGAVNSVGPMGPTAAAVWLGLNWWLY